MCPEVMQKVPSRRLGFVQVSTRIVKKGRLSKHQYLASAPEDHVLGEAQGISGLHQVMGVEDVDNVREGKGWVELQRANPVVSPEAYKKLALNQSFSFSFSLSSITLKEPQYIPYYTSPAIRSNPS